MLGLKMLPNNFGLAASFISYKTNINYMIRQRNMFYRADSWKDNSIYQYYYCLAFSKPNKPQITTKQQSCWHVLLDQIT